MKTDHNFKHERERHLIHLAADGRLNAAQRTQLDAHLAECAACRAYAEQIHAVEVRLSSVQTTRLVPSSASRQHITAAIQKRYRRYQMNKQILSITGTLAAIAGAITFFALFGRIIPSQRPAGAEQTRVAGETVVALTPTSIEQNISPRYFTRAESDQLPLQPFQLTDTPETETPNPGFIFNPNVAAVEQQAGFAIWQPNLQIPGLSFNGASYAPQEHVARLSFSGERSAGLLIAQYPLGFADLCAMYEGCVMIGASAVVEEIQIGAATGEYTIGGWNLTDAGPVWQNDPWRRTLRWQNGDIAFEMFYQGAPETMTKDALGQWAASLQENAVTENDSDREAASIQTLSSQAGFEIIPPAWLPDGYTLDGTSYNPEKNVACLLYRTALDSDSSASLVIAQTQAGPLPPLADWLTPNYLQEFGERALLEQDTLVVGGATNDQAIYIRSSLDPESYCQHSRLSAIKALVWQTTTRNFVIYGQDDFYQNGNFLTELELRRVAGGLTGVSTIANDTVDPERLPSIQAAQALANFPLRQPTELPDSHEFLYASYRQSGDFETVNLIYRNTSDAADASGLTFIQSTRAAKTLDDPAIYEQIIVNGEPGLYSPGICWDENHQPLTNCGAPQVLEWSENSITYSFFGYFDKESILATAERMAYIELTIAQAEALAGFKIQQPAQLPAGYQFDHATYESQNQAIVAIYNGPANETGFGLRVSANVTETLDMQYNAHPEYYERFTVRGQSALYFQGCWNSDVYEHDCNGSQYITWFEDNLKYSLGGVFSNDTARAFLSSIAESLLALDTPPKPIIKTSIGDFTCISAHLVKEIKSKDMQAPDGYSFLLIEIANADGEALVMGKFSLEAFDKARQQANAHILGDDGLEYVGTMGGWIDDKFVIGFVVPITLKTYQLVWGDDPPIDIIISAAPSPLSSANLDVLQSQATFEVIGAARLPSVYTLARATYNAAKNITCLGTVCFWLSGNCLW